MDQFEQHARKRPESCRDLDEFEWHFLESLRTETSFSQIRSSNDEAERSYLDLYWRRSPFLLVAWKFEANPSNNAIKKQIVYCLDMLGFNYALDGEDDSIFRIYDMGPNKSYIQLSVPSLKSEYTDLCQPFAATIVSVTTGYSRRFCPIKKNHDLHSMILELIGLRATFSNDDIALPRNPPKVPKNTIFNSLMDIYRGKAKKSPLVQEMVLAVARARPIDACLSLLDHFTGCYDGKTVLGSRIVVNRPRKYFSNVQPLSIVRLDHHWGYETLPVQRSAYPYTVILHDYNYFRELPKFSEYRVTRDEFLAIEPQPDSYEPGAAFLEKISTDDVVLDLRVPAQRVVLACIIITLFTRDYEIVVLPRCEKEEKVKEAKETRRQEAETLPLVVWSKHQMMSKAIEYDQASEVGGENSSETTEDEESSTVGSEIAEIEADAEARAEDPRFKSRLTVERMVRDRRWAIKKRECKALMLKAAIKKYGPPPKPARTR